jgi:hypothetical protein
MDCGSNFIAVLRPRWRAPHPMITPSWRDGSDRPGLGPSSPFQPGRMMAKPDACAELLCGADHVVGLERNTFLILIAAACVALATWFVIISALFELFGSERRYASNFGVSISKFRKFSR